MRHLKIDNQITGTRRMVEVLENLDLSTLAAPTSGILKLGLDRASATNRCRVRQGVLQSSREKTGCRGKVKDRLTFHRSIKRV